MVSLDIFVAVPIATREAVVIAGPDLHETNAAFEEASGGEALATEVVGFFLPVNFLGPGSPIGFEAIHLSNVVGLSGDVQSLGRGELHAGGELVAFDPGVETGIGCALREVLAIEFGKKTSGIGLGLRRAICRAFGGVEMRDGLLGPGANDRSLIDGGEEGGRPIFGTIGSEAAMVGEDDEGREVVVHAAEPVADPRAHAGEAGAVEAGGLQIGGLTVHAGFSGQIMDEGDVIDDLAQRGHGLAEHLAALPVWGEFPDRFFPRAESILEGFDVFSEVGFFAVAFDELGLEVEEIEMAGGATHEELDDAFGFWGELRFLAHHRGERNPAEAAAGLPKKVASIGHDSSPRRKIR